MKPFVIAFLVAAAPATTPIVEPAHDVLARNHAAGAMPADETAEYSYRYESAGLTGTRTDRVDLQTGAYVTSETAQGVGDGRGFDRQTPWQRDISGATTDQLGGDRVPVAINEAYRHANLWWRPDFGGATIKSLGREPIDGRDADHLSVTPRGGKRFDAWFDAANGLLVRIAEDQQFFHTQTLYQSYRREHGVMVPGNVTVDHGVGEAGYDHLTLERFAVTGARPPTTYARPKAPLTGASIVDGKASATVPFRLLNNHIYVDAMVNGRGPFTFIVDTGGHTLLSPRLITAVGLKAIGSTPMSGAGEKVASGGFVPFHEIAIGGVRLRDQIGFAAKIYDDDVEGINVDGMIGFELFARMATRIDYGREQITFTDPRRFVPNGAGIAVPFVFYDHLPMVRGRIGNLPARLDIDTGSRSEIDVTGPFVAANHLRERYPRGISAVTGWGAGGPSRSYVVRLPKLSLGSVSVGGPTAGLSQDKGGSISDPNYDGNVGSAFLKRFVVTFDYHRQIMYLKRIVPAPADAGRFDQSGMWINARPDGFEVVDLSPSGPAALAGLAVGDVITSIDGAAAVPATLADARKRLRTLVAGARVQVERIGKPPVVLILRDPLTA